MCTRKFLEVVGSIQIVKLQTMSKNLERYKTFLGILATHAKLHIMYVYLMRAGSLHTASS